jgi:hypothetical protein
MTLENTLLEKLSEWQPPPGRHESHVSAESWSASVTADRSDALGCLLWELIVQRDGTAEMDVQTWAAKVAERVRGLAQALKVVEVDDLRKQAQLRSESPQERNGKRHYHELVLSAIGHAVLRRFETANSTTKRQQVPFAITHEALAKIAGDLVAASV